MAILFNLLATIMWLGSFSLDGGNDCNVGCGENWWGTKMDMIKKVEWRSGGAEELIPLNLSIGQWADWATRLCIISSHPNRLSQMGLATSSTFNVKTPSISGVPL